MTNIKELLWRKKEKEKGLIIMQMDVSMKDSGRIVWKKVKVNISSQMKHAMKGSLRTQRKMEKENKLFKVISW